MSKAMWGFACFGPLLLRLLASRRPFAIRHFANHRHGDRRECKNLKDQPIEVGFNRDGSGRSNRTQTVPGAGAASQRRPELVATGGSAELPRQDSNLRPGDRKDVRTPAPRKQRRHLARGKSARKPRNAPESHPSDRTQTVPGEKECDA